MTRPMRNDGCFGMNSKNSMSCCLYPILSFSTKLSSGEKLEKDRYLPISSSLNAILSEFRDKAYKDIPAPKLRENEELLYIPNDPTTIESKHLKDADITPAERKPDVIGVFVPFLRNMFDQDGIEDYNHDAMVTAIGQGKLVAKGGKGSCKPTWGDVQQTWELKNTNKKMEFPGEDAVWNTEDILNRSHDQPVKEPSKPKTKTKQPVKRGREGDDDTQKRPNKKSCGGSSQTPSIFTEGEGSASSFSLSGPPESDRSLNHDVQCAFYAIERLRAAWFITHSTVTLLTGNW